VLASSAPHSPQSAPSLEKLFYSPEVSIRTALSSLILFHVHSGHSGSYVRQLLSAVRLVEKLQWIRPIVQQSDWMAVRYMEKGRPGILRTKHWFDFGFPAAAIIRTTSEDLWEAICLAILSACHLLRISEALTVKRTPDGKLYFRGCKSRSGEHTVEPGPYATRWLRCLAQIRRKRGVSASSCFFAKPDALQNALRELTKGTKYRDFRWHALRRFGAAQLHASGLRLPLLQIYGGWACPREALRYAQPDSSWEFISRTSAPSPVLEGGVFKAVWGTWTSGSLWSPWVRRELHSPDISAIGTNSRKRSRSQPAQPSTAEEEDTEDD
jgi:hypothetical protein